MLDTAGWGKHNNTHQSLKSPLSSLSQCFLLRNSHNTGTVSPILYKRKPRRRTATGKIWTQTEERLTLTTHTGCATVGRSHMSPMEPFQNRWCLLGKYQKWIETNPYRKTKQQWSKKRKAPQICENRKQDSSRTLEAKPQINNFKTQTQDLKVTSYRVKEH